MRKKFIAFPFLIFALALPPTASAQQSSDGERLEQSVSDSPLTEVLKQIEERFNIKISFSYDDLAGYRVSARISAKNIDEALAQALKGLPVSYTVSNGFYSVKAGKDIVGTVTVDKSENVSVSGTVVDTTGEPIIGAVIKIGSSTQAVTGNDGQFVLSLSKGKPENLIVSYIGLMDVKYFVSCKTDVVGIVIRMEDDAKSIGEVVVTGYQNIDRRHLTSAVSSVSMDDIRIPGVTNLEQMLQGKIPDLVLTNNSGELNATPKIRIRGTSTIIGNREPLWVVDGIIVNDPVDLSPDVLNDPDYVNRIGNAITGLNPQDIERLDVLKDAAATALYGTRAANGVIVITTKKGRVGKPQVRYSATATVHKRPYYTDRKVNLMNSKERVEFSQLLTQMHYIYPHDMPLVGYEYALQCLYDGTYTPDQFQQEVQKMETENTDWFDLLTRNSFSHDHNVNISGGSDKIRYYASLGYTNENDVIKDNNNNRYTANSKLDIALTDKLQLSFNISGYMSKKKYPQINTINYAYNTSRTIPAYNDDGTYSYYKRPSSDRNRFFNYNVLNELDNSFRRQNTSGATVTANLRYAPLNWLSFNGIVSASTSHTDQDGYYGENTYYAANLRYCEPGETPTAESLMPYGGELTTEKDKNKSYTVRLQANFNKTFGSEGQHGISAVLGGEANSNRYEAYARIDHGYYLDRGKKFMTDIPASFTSYDAWLRGNVPTITDNRTNLLSAYATLSYSYGNYFTLNANGRYDGSNKFGRRSNDKLLPVWSVSGMTDLMNVFHLGEQLPWVSSLVFKASYGEQGNMLDGQTSELVLRRGSVSAYYNELVSTAAAFANPDLRWEKTHSSNLAFEGSFLDNRLMVGFEYYYKKTNKAFMSKEISDVNGYSSYVVNSGDITNKGYNVNVTAIPVRNKDWYWSLSASLSKIMNEMKTAPGSQTYSLSDFLNGTAVVKGQPVGTFWSYKFTGLDPEDGGPHFDDGEDIKDELKSMGRYETYTTVLTPSGRRDPDVTGSINSTLSWKNWRLNVSLYYSLGAKTRLFRIFDDFVSGYSSEMNINRDLLKAWQKPGDEKKTNIPAVMGQLSPGYDKYWRHWSSVYDYEGVKIGDNAWTMYDYSNARVVSANYMKIQNVSLTYELPTAWLASCRLQRLAITLGATNLYTFCSRKLKGQTPTQGGFTEVQLSETPTWTLGLNVTF